MIGKGRGQNKKVERNQELFDDFTSGTFTTQEIIKKYGVSRARIYAIVNWVHKNNLANLK